ncbi:hypothetical protein LEMLEM_LOCUS24514 [Lemmus lemmus]
MTQRIKALLCEPRCLGPTPRIHIKDRGGNGLHKDVL